MKSRDIIAETQGKIIRASQINGGHYEPYGIPIEDWEEFRAAYKARYGTLLGSGSFDRTNLILCGVPVYPLEKTE